MTSRVTRWSTWDQIVSHTSNMQEEVIVEHNNVSCLEFKV